MPELPEVESFRVFAERHLVGRTISRARFTDTWMLRDLTPREAAHRLRGRTLSTTQRRGKHLIVYTANRPKEVDAPALALHFGMSGYPSVDRPTAHDRLVLELDDGTRFRYVNTRRLGAIRVIARTEVADLLWPLGPEPLEAPVDWLRDVLAGKRTPIKAALLDQRLLAGVGNMYADEALFEAGVRPGRLCSSLSGDQVARLHRRLKARLRQGIKANVAAGLWAPMKITIPRTAGAPCLRCGTPVRMSRIGGRSSYWCPVCQT